MHKPTLEDLKKQATRSMESSVKHVYTLADKFKQDPDKESRLANLMCKPCHYKVAIAGQAFTKAICHGCGEEMMFSNTNTHALCQKCAKDNNMCTRCGCDLASEI